MKIFIVEVVKQMREMLALRFELFGFEILCAENRQEAIELFNLNKETIDFICVSGCLERRTEFDTPDLVDLFLNSGFADRIVGMSSIQGIRGQINRYPGVRACTKMEAPDLVKEILAQEKPLKVA